MNGGDVAREVSLSLFNLCAKALPLSLCHECTRGREHVTSSYTAFRKQTRKQSARRHLSSFHQSSSLGVCVTRHTRIGMHDKASLSISLSLSLSGARARSLSPSLYSSQPLLLSLSLSLSLCRAHSPVVVQAHND